MPMETDTNAECGVRNAEVSAGGGGLTGRRESDAAEAAGAGCEAFAKFFQIREFDRARDLAWLAEWHEGHGGAAPPAELLPRLGIVVLETDGGESEDLGALWLYMDNSVGVCFVDHIVTRPGLALAKARRALLFGLAFLKERAAAMDYGLMLVHTRPAIARTLRPAGFREDKRDLVAMWTLTGETNGNRN